MWLISIDFNASTLSSFTNLKLLCGSKIQIYFQVVGLGMEGLLRPNGIMLSPKSWYGVLKAICWQFYIFTNTCLQATINLGHIYQSFLELSVRLWTGIIIEITMRLWTSLLIGNFYDATNWLYYWNFCDVLNRFSYWKFLRWYELINWKLISAGLSVIKVGDHITH